MTLTEDFEKRLEKINALVKDFLGRVELGNRAWRRADAAGNVVQTRDIFRLMQEDAVKKGAVIIAFLEECEEKAKRIPALVIVSGGRRKLPEERAVTAAESAKKASKKLSGFFTSIRMFMEGIVRSFERGFIPSASLDTLRVYMVKTPALEKSHTEAMLADLDQAETFLTARENANTS